MLGIQTQKKVQDKSWTQGFIFHLILKREPENRFFPKSEFLFFNFNLLARIITRRSRHPTREPCYHEKR
jgi:hypothetical protein